MSQPSAEPYSQTILLDANRLSSEEFSASNLAQTDSSVFTNRVAGGLTLDIGDQVSIQSAHIAQRGAGSSVIEMKGKTIGKKTINYTNFTNSSFIGSHLIAQGGGTPQLQRYAPTGFAKVDAENIDEEVDIKDNEATIVVEFYKNANGENCMTLPRNFGNVSGRNASVVPYNHSGGRPLTNSQQYWEVDDGYPLGTNVFEYDRFRRLILNSDRHQDFDWMDKYSLRTFTGLQLPGKIKVRMDNSRFTLFKRSSMVYNGSFVSTDDLKASLQPRGYGVVKPDPAIAPYVRFRKKVKLKIDEGYNTPSNIASQITDQLTEPEESRIIISGADIDKTIIQESKLNIAFNAPSYESFNVSGNQHFFRPTMVNQMPTSVSHNASLDSRAVAYNNAYDYIGFKRPDFVEAGRRIFAYHGNKTRFIITDPNSIIRTNITYSEEAVKGIRDWFDTQASYPELLDGGVDDVYPRSNFATYSGLNYPELEIEFRKTARFIHMDLSRESQGTAKSDTDALGDDMYNVSYTSQGANASDRTSCPVFIYYNNNSSHLTTKDTPADSYDNLAYGFAMNEGGFISFTVENIGGIPDHFLQLGLGGTGNFIDSSTKLGYDYHFSAYGNAAIALHAGYNPLQYFGHQHYNNAEYIENVYVGADNPLFTFDNVENRFEFKNLHTAEKTGNFYNAGDPQVPGDILGPPPSAQAQDAVYYVNKQMRYDNWSPDMHPYPKINLSGTTASGTVQSFIASPQRLNLGVVYDAHSGISIVDMGVDEKNWENSIWGILGFQYGQFNGSGNNIGNTNFRFNNLNSNVSGITTNALLTSLQSQEYFQNAFSIPLIKPMVGSNIFYYDNARKHSDTFTSLNASHIVTPAISVQQESTIIKAADLPRKILRGYFLIKSDIIDQTGYYQSANPMSVMCSVGKYNSADDFVNFDGPGPVFTVTRKKTITDVKTQITDPEGSLAQVGDNSGVVYRVDKQIKTDLKFGENLLAGMYGKPPK